MVRKKDEQKLLIKIGAIFILILAILISLVVIGIKNLDKNEKAVVDAGSLIKHNTGNEINNNEKLDVKTDNPADDKVENNINDVANSNDGSKVLDKNGKFDVQLEEISVDDNIKKSINENKNKDINISNKITAADKSDPFYTQIKAQIKKQNQIETNDLKNNYYPKENYIKNAADNNGNIHVFKKKNIIIYVPEGDYYDPVMQAFVTYNAYFKGIVSFNATNDPDKSDIKIVLTDNLKDLIDGNAIGVGGPHKFDSNGNILYSELKILNKNFHTGNNASKIQVYNTALHEIGHCIGIQGHSSDVNDVMYKGGHSDKTLRVFSNRDIETIKLMYSGRDDLISGALKNAKREKLIENYNYALENGHGADAYLKLADSYLASNQYNEAIKAYNRALKLNPDNPRIYNAISNYYIKVKNYDSAIQYAKYGLTKAKTSEQRSKANSQIAHAYEKKNNYNQALTYYNEALKQNYIDDYYNIYFDMSLIHSNNKKYDNSIMALKKSLDYAKTDTERAKGNNNIGFNYNKKGNYESASKYYAKALTYEPSKKMYFINYLRSCYNLNNKKAASEAYKKYIKNYNQSSFNESDKAILDWAKN